MQKFEWLKTKMKFSFKKNKKNVNKDNRIIDSSIIQDQGEKVGMLADDDDHNQEFKNTTEKKNIEQNLIDKKLPKELIIRIFSYLDIVSLCRCAQVSKYWNTLALDGSNLQHIDLFHFQKDVSQNVIENIAIRCNEFLRSIRLENCRSINDISIEIFCIKCPNVELLNLKQCFKLTDHSFINIGNNLQYLTSLNLESCNISDQAIMCIAKKCTKLQVIEISWCINISPDGLFNFACLCSNLRHFSAKGLANMKNRVLCKIADNCPELISLILNNCNSISDEGIISVANNCHFLKHLCVSNCKNLSDASLIALGKNCHDLCIFESSGCSNLSDNGFSALSKGCPSLMRLDLEECLRITNTTIQNLANNCFKLKHLALSRCENINDDGIRLITNPTIGNLNETLQVLELDNCPLITDASLEELSLCQNLMQLELYDCQLITKNGIKRFQTKFPQIKVHAYFAPAVTNNNNRPIRSCSFFHSKQLKTMQSIITSTFNSVKQNYIRNSRAIAVLWFVFTVCFTIINIVVFLQPWLGDTDVIDKEGYFGLFEYCKYIIRKNHVDPNDHSSKNNHYYLNCSGSWAELSSALNPIATFSIGFSALINLACIASFLVLLLFVSPSIVFAICGFLQIISTMFMILGCVIYPNNWDDPRIVDVCETSKSYFSGKCQIKWAYILAIIGIFDVLFLGILALVMSRRQINNYQISSINNIDYKISSDLDPEISQNASKIESHSFRDFQI